MSWRSFFTFTAVLVCFGPLFVIVGFVVLVIFNRGGETGFERAVPISGQGTVLLSGTYKPPFINWDGDGKCEAQANYDIRWLNGRIERVDDDAYLGVQNVDVRFQRVRYQGSYSCKS